MAPAHQMTHITEYMQFMIYLNNVINANTVTSPLIPAPLRMNLSFHFCFLSFHPAVFDTNTLGFIPKDSDMNVIGKEGRENLDIFT